MINLTYRFDQNSCTLEIAGMPDVSNGDAENTIGILYSWSLKIIGSPILEGKKEHLDNMMQVVLQYSRAYISGIKKTFISEKNMVILSPLDGNHKLQLNSSRKGVKPLEIVLDDSELADLTRCLDLLRFDSRFNIVWDIKMEKPYTKRYIINNLNKSTRNLNVVYAFFIFVLSSTLFLFIPVNKQNELNDSIKTSYNSAERLIN